MSAKELDHSSEEKIKVAARTVFQQRGFAGAKTRDIAEAAGINLALLNYYFRSKRKLFELIMFEGLQQFMQSMSGVLDHQETSFEEKLDQIVDRYLSLFLKEPDLPLFMLSELRQGLSSEIIKRINFKGIVMNSAFARQYQEKQANGEIGDLPFLQFVVNLLGFCAFPFVASPIVRTIGQMDESQYKSFMEDRRRLIPMWLKDMLRVD